MRSRNLPLVVGALLLIAVAGATLVETVWGRDAETRVDVAQRLQPPSRAHPWGTDDLGRDLLVRVLAGGRIALEVGAVAVGLGAAVGVPLGLVGARIRGWPSGVLAYTMDALMAFPAILLAPAMIAALGPGHVQAMVAIGLVLVPAFWRLARAQALVVWTREFVEAARALGAAEGRLLIRHVLPHVIPVLLVQATTAFSGAILSEASLSFLGLGSQPPTPSWGRMLQEATAALGVAPWMALFPGLALGVTVLGVNLLGDGVRDALDPQMRRVLPPGSIV